MEKTDTKYLSDLAVGESCNIVQITAESVMRRRLLDMGITRGAQVFLRKKAPLGDPIQIAIRGYELTLRKREAQCIEIENIKMCCKNEPKLSLFGKKHHHHDGAGIGHMDGHGHAHGECHCGECDCENKQEKTDISGDNIEKQNISAYKLENEKLSVDTCDCNEGENK